MGISDIRVIRIPENKIDEYWNGDMNANEMK